MENQLYKQSAKVREWLEDYSEEDVEHLISYYEEAKGEEENVKTYYRNRVLHERQAAEESAMLCLKSILHKKMFNAECLWRAEKLQLPLKNTWSVDKYEDNLFEATFLEPITQEELDTFINYYLSDEYEPFEDVFTHNYERLIAYALGQKYESALSAFDHILNPDPHYPHWFAWYDRHLETGDLVKLPDDRGDSERVLLSACNKKKNVDMSGLIEGFKTIDQIKPLMLDHPEFLAFAEHIKDYRMRTFFKTRTDQIQEDDKTEEGLLWIHYLEDMFYQEIPIPSADDWRDAVHETGFRHLQQNTIKLLPELYEQYLHDPDFRSRNFDEEEWLKGIKSEDMLEDMLEEGREYLEQRRRDELGE